MRTSKKKEKMFQSSASSKETDGQLFPVALCLFSTSPNSSSSKRSVFVCVFLKTYINRHNKFLDETRGQA